uniref:Succinoglycan biosynthesis protein ExoO n=1 Tax=Tetraselmis sp. GSL018 TaxID=582737 RepID=A0A061RV84_9CHLO
MKILLSCAILFLCFIGNIESVGGESCPNQCYRHGACTRGTCHCHRGFAGPDCFFQLQNRDSGPPPYSEEALQNPGRPANFQMRIAVASSQILGSTPFDDLDVVIPGLTTARQLRAQQHNNVTLIFCLHEQKHVELRTGWQRVLAAEGIDLVVIYYTQHYYLPANLAHSFETYAWISDYVKAGNRPFDVVFFSDGHGLAYYSALAKHQDLPGCGLRNTVLVMGVQLPLLWLTTKGGGGGLKNVDELEANFIEHESARLVDHVVISSIYFDTWMADRNWKVPWTTYVLPQPLPSPDLERLRANASATTHAGRRRGVAPGRQFVFLIEGPGSGVLGKSVSSGKNANSAMSSQDGEGEEDDADRFQYVTDDILMACDVASALAGQLTKEESEEFVFTFFLLGANAGTSPHGANQISYCAESRAWGFQWAVARGSTMQAVTHAAAPGRVTLLQAARFRGGATLLLVRRVIAALSVGGAENGRGAVISATEDTAQVLRSFVAVSGGGDEGAIAGVLPGEVASRMLETARGHRRPLVPAQDELELAAASATWLNFLPYHTRIIRQEIYAYDGASELLVDLSDAKTQKAATETLIVDGIAVVKPRSSSDAPVALKATPLVGEPLAAWDTAWFGSEWRRLLAARQAERTAGWAARQLGIDIKALNATRSAGAALRRPEGNQLVLERFPPYREPLVTVVITHYNRPKLLPLAVQSVAEQTYKSIQLVVIDDGSPNADVPAALDQLEAKFSFQARGWSLLREPNRYLGGARNRGVSAARGEYVLFMDDDNVAKPYEVEFFVRAMESTGADILTSFVDFVRGDMYPRLPSVEIPRASQNPLPDGIDKNFRRSPSFVFLGGSADVGIFKNCFGDANSFFRKSSFLKMGGYSEDRGIGYEDWELYSRAVLKGYNLMVVPEALYWYRFTGGSMQKTTSYSRSRQRALRGYIDALRAKRREDALASSGGSAVGVLEEADGLPEIP